MQPQELKIFQGKRVKLFTKAKRTFSGKVEKISEETLTITDKFGETVLISLEAIENIQSNGRDS